MLEPMSSTLRRSSLALGGTLLLAAGVAGCETASPQADLDTDYRTCASFGAEPGSRAYSDCMLAQQRRRDTAQLDSIEKTRALNEAALAAQRTADLARRGRCARDPDRRECGR